MNLAVNPEQPIVFLSSTEKKEITIGENGKPIPVVIPIAGPWMLVGFNMTNKNKSVITIVAVTFLVTGPDGKIRESVLQSDDDTGAPLGYFAQLRPEKDADCNGKVSDAEDALTNPIVISDCELDAYNPSIQGNRRYIYDLLSGVTDLEPYRNSTYFVRVRFEGWVGPFSDPQSNFFKEITLTAGSSN